MQHALTRIRTFLPMLAFFAGFIWDALTIGRFVTTLDLWLLTGYLAAAGGLLWWLGYYQQRALTDARPPQLPYLGIQFLFGGLFSALFIFYIKSASHLFAILWSLGLALLLVANEFIKDKYRRFTITWTFFGLCAILLFNFLLPFMIGSIHYIWFYLSTLAGACLVYLLRWLTPGRPGRIGPVWLIAAILMTAYPLDIVPPVPLVKRDMHIGLGLEKLNGHYLITVDQDTVWNFWRTWDDNIHLPAGERLYCLSAVFAPRGLNTRLYHRWQYLDGAGRWVSTERIGFNLTGGRDGGFRGYTYKQNVQPGKWRVSVETENGRTVAIHAFNVLPETTEQARKRLRIS